MLGRRVNYFSLSKQEVCLAAGLASVLKNAHCMLFGSGNEKPLNIKYMNNMNCIVTKMFSPQ